MTLARTALLALNIAIIACFVRRRAAHNNRGVSASSSKTTTLEVFSPATTPGTTQGEELPITSTKGIAPITRHSVESQPGVGETEQTSLFQGNDNSGRQANPPDQLSLTANVARSRHRSSSRSHQNGGQYIQKYCEDIPNYYSPLPQNHSVSVEKGVMPHPGNPPDVCPTASDSLDTLTRRHPRPHPEGQNQRQQHQQAPEQQQQKQQLKQHRQLVSDMYPMEQLSAPTGGYFHAVTDHPRRHSVDEKRRSGSQLGHHHHHLHHPEQQLAQKHGSQSAEEGHEGSWRPYNHHNLDQFNAFIQNHRDINTATAGWAWNREDHPFQLLQDPPTITPSLPTTSAAAPSK